jgi:hypothetical protein
MKQFFSPARQAREAYYAGLKNGAITPPAFHRGVMTLTLVCVWACITMLALWTHRMLTTEVAVYGRLALDGNVLMALIGGIALVFCIRKAIFVTVLAVLVIAGRTPTNA